jgi:hypothetical protein
MLKLINYAAILGFYFLLNPAYAQQEIKPNKFASQKCSDSVDLQIPKNKIKKKIIVLCINNPELTSVFITLSTPDWWVSQDVEDMLDYFLGHFGISDINSVSVVAIKVNGEKKDSLYLSTAAFTGIYNP